MGKTYDGGAKDGLLNVAYGMLSLSKAERTPVANGIKIDRMRFDLFVVFIMIEIPLTYGYT